MKSITLFSLTHRFQFLGQSKGGKKNNNDDSSSEVQEDYEEDDFENDESKVHKKNHK